MTITWSPSGLDVFVRPEESDSDVTEEVVISSAGRIPDMDVSNECTRPGTGIAEYDLRDIRRPGIDASRRHRRDRAIIHPDFNRTSRGVTHQLEFNVMEGVCLDDRTDCTDDVRSAYPTQRKHQTTSRIYPEGAYVVIQPVSERHISRISIYTRDSRLFETERPEKR